SIAATVDAMRDRVNNRGGRTNPFEGPARCRCGVESRLRRERGRTLSSDRQPGSTRWSLDPSERSGSHSMGLRLGAGPVFAWEWLRTSRRWQTYAARAAFVAILLAGVSFVWMEQVTGRTLSYQRLANVGTTFFVVVVFVQLAVVML